MQFHPGQANNQVHPVIHRAAALCTSSPGSIQACTCLIIHYYPKQTLFSHVRKTPPESSTIHTVKKVKIGLASGSQGRMAARDFEAIGKSILKGAFGHYESQLCTEWPYPSEDREILWARRAWSRACSERGTKAELVSEALRLVSSINYCTAGWL
jgi:hypothetical protein